MKIPNDCETDPAALSVSQARERITAMMTPLSGIERVAIRSGLDRVLASEIISPINVPGHNNSAMDGYALRGDDLPAEGSIRLELIGEAFAGSNFLGSVARGQCVSVVQHGNSVQVSTSRRLRRPLSARALENHSPVTHSPNESPSGGNSFETVGHLRLMPLTFVPLHDPLWPDSHHSARGRDGYPGHIAIRDGSLEVPLPVHQ